MRQSGIIMYAVIKIKFASQIHRFCQCFCLPPLSRLSTVDCVVEFIRTVGGSGITAERWPGKTHPSHSYILYGHTLQCAHFGKIHTIRRRVIYAHMNTHRLTQNPGPKITSVSHIESSLQMEKSQAASSHVFDSVGSSVTLIFQLFFLSFFTALMTASLEELGQMRLHC